MGTVPWPDALGCGVVEDFGFFAAAIGGTRSFGKKTFRHPKTRNTSRPASTVRPIVGCVSSLRYLDPRKTRMLIKIIK